MKKAREQDTFFPENEPTASTSNLQEPSEDAPLAERCRPRKLEDFFGQESLLGPDAPLRKAIERDRVPSMILWGPPGSGKTTLAHLIARLTRSQFLKLSATDSGIKELRGIVEAAQEHRKTAGGRTILFIDEIHRWNKSQQDALLPHVESGLVTLIGATTENPSFEVNGALLSRVTVFTLQQLEPEHVIAILRQGIGCLLKDGVPIQADDEALEAIASVSHGDARVALNSLQSVANFLHTGEDPIHLTLENTSGALQEKRILYDKSGEEHYNLISALHKSVRGSDPQGTLYWLARMLESGEDPLYLARRLIRMAIEDIGLAAPNALAVAVAARDAYHMLGSPEGDLALAEAAVYLATSPKSNAIYVAFGEAREAVKKYGYQPAPLHIRNAPTGLMKKLGYGKDYLYAHDFKDAYAEQQYLPDRLKNKIFYTPTNRGYEKTIQERLDYWKSLAEGRSGEPAEDKPSAQEKAPPADES